MTLSIGSKLKDLLADGKAKAILESMKVESGKPYPGWTDDPQLQQAAELSLAEIACYNLGKVDVDELWRVDEELGKL